MDNFFLKVILYAIDAKKNLNIFEVTVLFKNG